MTDIFLIKEDVTIKEAMRQMNSTGQKVLFIVDNDKKLLGSLTDGDIRRWILKEGSLNAKIENIYNKDPLSVTEPYNVEHIKKLMLDSGIEWIPVLNLRGKVVNILLWKEIFGGQAKAIGKKLSIPVVIMAGGQGTRLDPFTKILPKPLIPIGDKAIIEIIMDKFHYYGVNEFYLSVNHKAKMIKSYFEEMNTKYTIRYIEEERPLGTAGGLKFLQGKIKGSLMVSNCDIIIDCDYSEIVDFHNNNDYDLTMVGSFRHFAIPYGVCEIKKNGLLAKIIEKPEYDFLVSTGMCVLKEKILKLIPKNEKFHITDLIKSAQRDGCKIGVFPISEKLWIDVGQWEEYHKSLKLLRLE